MGVELPDPLNNGTCSVCGHTGVNCTCKLYTAAKSDVEDYLGLDALDNQGTHDILDRVILFKILYERKSFTQESVNKLTKQQRGNLLDVIFEIGKEE